MATMTKEDLHHDLKKVVPEFHWNDVEVRLNAFFELNEVVEKSDKTLFDAVEAVNKMNGSGTAPAPR